MLTHDFWLEPDARRYAMSAFIPKRFSVPEGPEKPLWSSMIGTVPMLYLFWEPLQSNAPLSEWSWTVLSFGAFLALAVVGTVYWSRPHIMVRACVAMLVLAVTFTTYQPHGVIYFVYVAAYIPLAFRGRPIASLLLIAATATTALLLWWLL
jgi:hypothetical protein